MVVIDGQFTKTVLCSVGIVIAAALALFTLKKISAKAEEKKSGKSNGIKGILTLDGGWFSM